MAKPDIPPDWIVLYPDTPDQVCVDYLSHLTHVDNLASVLRSGLVSLNALRNRNTKFASLANWEVQGLRDRIWLTHGGKKWSLHNYVPLYFAHRNPMSWRQRHYWQGMVFIEVSPSVILRPGTVFSDGNASRQGLTRNPQVHVVVRVSQNGEPCERLYYERGYVLPSWTPQRSVSEVYTGVHNLEHLNWQVLCGDRYALDDGTIRRRCAEVLVPDTVPVTHFRGLLVCDQELVDRVKSEVEAACLSLPVSCQPRFVF